MVFIVQVLKDELRHKILLEAQHLFLQRGYARTSLQMIADKVNISKSNLYHYFKSKEDLFYELTDGAAEGLKKLILRLRDKRFDPRTGQREYQVLLTEEVLSLLLAEKYGLLPSGGSDFHGENKPDIRLGTGRGTLNVPDEWYEALREAAEKA